MATWTCQICLDYFSIITYMTDYVCKPETKTTELLKEVKKTKEKEKVSTRDLMYSLAQAYLTSREMGECEAYYKLDTNLHYKQSNIKAIFVGSGFPHNRSKFLRKCKTESDDSRGFTVDGHEGKFMETQTVHEKYSLRPESMRSLCLAQFAMRYSLLSSTEVNKIKESGKDPCQASEETGFEGNLKVVTGNEEDIWLLDFIELQDNKIMKLRKFEAVLRRHKFKEERDPHEFFFSEMLLFLPWTDESDLFPENAEKCQKLYVKFQTQLENVKQVLFPHLTDVELGRNMVEKYEFDKGAAETGAELDPEGEQENEPDAAAELAGEYGGLDPDDLQGEDPPNQAAPPAFFRAPPVIEMAALIERTRQLVWEQRVVLNIVIDFCRNLVMAQKSRVGRQAKPPLLITHGGAGTGKSLLINLISHRHGRQQH